MIVRLLDPPLHEFLPNTPEEMQVCFVCARVCALFPPHALRATSISLSARLIPRRLLSQRFASTWCRILCELFEIAA